MSAENFYELIGKAEFEKAKKDFSRKYLTISKGCHIIKAWNEDDHPRDENGRFVSTGGSFSRPTLKLSKKEYGKVTHAINDVYKTKYEGKSIGYISIGKSRYRFEIADFNEYNIYRKEKNDG